MADEFLENAGGWTPVPDKLVREFGFEVAYVWGRIHRYCQMANGVCIASHQTIADRAGMSRRTLIEKLNILLEAGYIEDKTPDLKNKPHTYCTRIGEDKITSAMQISHTENDIPLEDNEGVRPEGKDVGMRNLHSDNADNAQSDPSTMQNLQPHYAEFAQPAMQNLHLKKDSLETLKETKEREPPTQRQKGQKEITPVKDRVQAIPAFKVFVEITEYHAITKHWRSEMAKIVGDKPENLEFWRKVVIGWTGKYPTKHNVEGMLDFYKRREIPGYQQPQNGAKPHGTYRRNDKQLTGHDSKSKPTYDKHTDELVYPDGTRVPAG